MQWYKESIGSRIKYERLGRGLSRSDLAQMVGFSVDVIERIERGISMPIDNILAVAEVLDIPWSKLARPVGRGRILQKENAYGSHENLEAIP